MSDFGPHNPWLTIANPQGPERFTVWCGLYRDGMLCLVFIDGTATCGICLSLLSTEFVTFLVGCGNLMSLARFQQDGAIPHTSIVQLSFFTTPNPCLYFLSGCLNDKATNFRNWKLPSNQKLKPFLQKLLPSLWTVLFFVPINSVIFAAITCKNFSVKIAFPKCESCI
jgi:hypothetical protein